MPYSAYPKPANGLPVQKFLTTAGDGTGNPLAIGNYTTPTDFYYQSTGQYDIHSLLICIAQQATFGLSDYGAITGGITNGVKFFVKQNGLAEIPLLSGTAVKHNYEWSELSRGTSLSAFAGNAQVLSINFDIEQDYGEPIVLQAGDRFIARLNNNFTSLISHTFGLRGIKY